MPTSKRIRHEKSSPLANDWNSCGSNACSQSSGASPTIFDRRARCFSRDCSEDLRRSFARRVVSRFRQESHASWTGTVRRRQRGTRLSTVHGPLIHLSKRCAANALQRGAPLLLTHLRGLRRPDLKGLCKRTAALKLRSCELFDRLQCRRITFGEVLASGDDLQNDRIVCARHAQIPFVV